MLQTRSILSSTSRWIGAGLIGMATGGGLWRVCYHQSDIQRLLGTVGLTIAAVIGAALFGYGLSDPKRSAVALVAATPPVALATYLWLTAAVDANRCWVPSFIA